MRFTVYLLILSSRIIYCIGITYVRQSCGTNKQVWNALPLHTKRSIAKGTDDPFAGASELGYLKERSALASDCGPQGEPTGDHCRGWSKTAMAHATVWRVRHKKTPHYKFCGNARQYRLSRSSLASASATCSEGSFSPLAQEPRSIVPRPSGSARRLRHLSSSLAESQPSSFKLQAAIT
jgi:hypothetical protein